MLVHTSSLAKALHRFIKHLRPGFVIFAGRALFDFPCVNTSFSFWG
jgi:hypothetical protein